MKREIGEEEKPDTIFKKENSICRHIEKGYHNSSKILEDV